MPIRNRHKIGDHLMRDDESGAVHYASEMMQIWDGSWRHHTMYETRQPQEFVRAKNDPVALRNVRPEPDFTPPVNAQSIFIGNTNIRTPTGPASHLYDPGIGDMAVGTTFVVR